MTMISAPGAAIGLFVAVFALATLRRVHLGILMFVAACGVGTGLAGLSLRDVVGGFPLGILLLVAGVTYFFGIAHLNGTVDRTMGRLLRHAGGRPAVIPVVFFVLAALASAMGSPQAGLVTAPVAMPTARRAGVDIVLMAIAINSGISAGAFAPTSLFGIVTYRIAREAGIAMSAMTLLVVAVVANLLLLGVALVLFSGGTDAPEDHHTPGDTRAPRLTKAPGDTIAPTGGATPVATADRQPVSFHQAATLAAMVTLVGAIVFCSLRGIEPDIGVITLSLGAALTLFDPSIGPRAFARIDWSTAFVVGGIVTYVNVLQRLDALNLMGQAAVHIGTPLVAAVVVCLVAALVSAFASTTAVLAALVPLAVPLATTDGVAGWALITALAVSATIVDASPFSNTGATLIASTPETQRPRLHGLLLRWGMAMVVVGPLVLVPLLTFLGRR